MHLSDMIVLCPTGWVDAGIPIAACRAGARGFLDLEYATENLAQNALRRIDHFTSTPYGIKIGALSRVYLGDLLARASDRLIWVIISGCSSDELPALVRQIRTQGCKVILEATSFAEASLAQQLEVDELILKGQEAGGRVGNETSYVLIQQWLAHLCGEGGPTAARIPFHVHGGIGAHTAAACVLAGARGIVLDAQLLLTRESPLPADLRQRVTAFDGSETTIVGDRLGLHYRVYSPPGLTVVAELLAEEERIATAYLTESERREAWLQTLQRLSLAGPPVGLWMLGQDGCLSANLARQGATVAGILDLIRTQVIQNLNTAREKTPLAEGSPLATLHGTRYPIVQGPMTRVSDTAAFAGSVADGGGLPFLALALLRQAEVQPLLDQTSKLLGKKPWGVGILGFVPAEIRNEQLAAIRKTKPPFAVIAGGRPDQARELEKEGISTYLHVPSPGLLRLFLRDGARKFIFEGRECGGHVGPRTSFVLWENMIEVLLEHLAKAGRAAENGDGLAIVFAGGIHDDLSAAMVAALAAPLVERDVSIGVLMGTAYLFTREAVEGGAIVSRFQQEALKCSDTVLLQTAPGHAIRCVPTPYREDFEQERRRLTAAGRPHEEVARTLEWMNIGRLRLASKGLERPATGAPGQGLVSVPEDEQYARGMYMIGQVATLRDKIVTVPELHHEVSAGSTKLLKESTLTQVLPSEEEPHRPPCDIAIIGMACFYPGANSVEQFWTNILAKQNVVTEIPKSHWDWRLYYDPDPRARDKIISKWGGFLQDMTFDPVNYGITPKSLLSIEPLQLFLLESARLALMDAGYDPLGYGADRAAATGNLSLGRPFSRERTATILGIGGGGSPLAVQYGFRTCLPLLNTVPNSNLDGESVLEAARPLLPEWTEDSFPGILFNVAVGRVANRFNLGGPNYAIDAACGSSLAAVQACVRELELGTSDLAIAMGADTVQTPYAYMAFSKTHALSPKGRCRPFDAAADGIVLSEGVAAVILKRLPDAIRDGDKVYAVIKGMGASSDGRDKGLTAPRAEGQMRALKRAYGQAGISPASVELIEAHGTGTVVGDQTEARALGQFLSDAGAAPQSCAIGSVKSMIGHTKCAAGIAGLIKTAMALHTRTLPPTLAETPNPKGNFENGPLYLQTETRPWVHGRKGPRYAGVSAFGFGGTNFHAVLAEYDGDFGAPIPAMSKWPVELYVFGGRDRAGVLAGVERCLKGLSDGAKPELAELAAGCWRAAGAGNHRAMLSVVAGSLEELTQRLTTARDNLKKEIATFSDPSGIYFSADVRSGVGSEGVAFLFPGQGSQYVGMGSQVSLAFPCARETLDRAERALLDKLDQPLGRYLYPPSAFQAEREAAQREVLKRTEIAQPALGAVDLALFKLLTWLGVEPKYVAGHSYGEFVALHAAGVLSEDDLYHLSHRRGEVISRHAGKMPGGMVSVQADEVRTTELTTGIAGLTVANANSPVQTVVAGTEEGLQELLSRCKDHDVRAQRIPVACAFHSPLVAGAREPLAEAITACTFRTPTRMVYSNTTASVHATNPDEIKKVMVDHLTSPVRFRDQIEAMYKAGARLFLEVGPRAVLTGLVRQTLDNKPHLALASDIESRSGVVQLLHVLGQLIVQGVAVRGERLFEIRRIQPIDPAGLNAKTGSQLLTPTTWIVNSVRNRPHNAPEPRLLGQTIERPLSPKQPVQVSATKPTPPVAAGPSPQPKPTVTPPTRESQPARPTPPMPVPHNANGQHASSHTGIPALPADEASQVMLRFQDLMGKFLDTQKTVMTAYLQGGTAPSNGPTIQVPVVQQIPKMATPAPTPLPAPSPPAPVVSSSAPPAPSTPAPVAVTPEPAPAAKPKADREWLTAQLQELISGRTGYPKEMLGMDIDLEADLGIDSIKRVEILAEVAQRLEGGTEGSLPAGIEMEKLTTIGTLRGIIDYLDNALNQSAPKTAPAGKSEHPHRETVNGAGSHKPHTNGDQNGTLPDIQRALVDLVDCPMQGTPSSLLGGGVVLFTDDGTGVAWSMASRLADLGRSTAILRMPGQGKGDEQGIYTGDLSDQQTVLKLLGRIREEYGAIGGLVHLLPLEPLGEDTWEQRARRDTRSLYLFAQALEEDLRSAGRQGYAFLMGATRMGGTFGFGEGDLPDDYSCGQGGIPGFLKCLGQEWPEVTVRAVDLDPSEQSSDLGDHLLAELAAPDGPFEIGRRQGRRLTWAPRAAELDTGGNGVNLLQPGEVVLITGGARGITAEIAVELARRYQPTLLLVGRSPLPEEEESEDTRNLHTPAEIKGALIARHQREGRPAAPAQVEAAYQKLMVEREIRNNLQRIKEAGSTLHYYSADVRNENGFGKLLDELQNRYGEFAGVIHGAGVIEDRLVRSKTPESFDRVFDTKVLSAAILLKKVQPERLKFCVLFASLASRYGNKGQADYAAANEVLSKLAWQLDRTWKGRVVSIAWGPWSQIGMVADLEKHLVQRGLRLIGPDEGPTLLVEELIYGHKGESEVILAGGAEAIVHPSGREAATAN